MVKHIRASTDLQRKSSWEQVRWRIFISWRQKRQVVNVSRKRLSAFVNERIPYTTKRLAIALVTSVDLWPEMQNAVDILEMENNNDEWYQALGKLATAS